MQLPLRRYIADNSAYSSGDVEKFLKASKRNVVVLTDYAAIEAYKSHGLSAVYEQAELLSRFPQQILVLKDTRKICGLRGRNAGLIRRMINEAETSEYPEFCKNVLKAKLGDRYLREQLTLRSEAASRQSVEWLSAGELVTADLAGIGRGFREDELRAIRTKGPLSEATKTKITSAAVHLTLQLNKKHPEFKKIPLREIPYTFTFRASLSLFALSLEWISVGKTKSSPELARNDLIDVCVVAYATFFDGLLSDDHRQMRIYHEIIPMLA